MKGIKGTLKKNIAVLRLKQGDTEAFGYLYDIYIEKIYRYIYFRISDQPTAHDISQDVFLRTWEHIVSKKPIGNLQSFIYKIAYHKVVDYYRSKDRQAVLIDDVGETAAGSSELDSSELELYLLMKHVRKLKSEYQDVIVLRHVEGLSIGEIADIISKDASNVRVTLHRAMESLKKIYPSSSNKREI